MPLRPNKVGLAPVPRVNGSRPVGYPLLASPRHTLNRTVREDGLTDVLAIFHCCAFCPLCLGTRQTTRGTLGLIYFPLQEDKMQCHIPDTRRWEH